MCKSDVVLSHLRVMLYCHRKERCCFDRCMSVIVTVTCNSDVVLSHICKSEALLSDVRVMLYCHM